MRQGKMVQLQQQKKRQRQRQPAPRLCVHNARETFWRTLAWSTCRGARAWLSLEKRCARPSWGHRQAAPARCRPRATRQGPAARRWRQSTPRGAASTCACPATSTGRGEPSAAPWNAARHAAAGLQSAPYHLQILPLARVEKVVHGLLEAFLGVKWRGGFVGSWKGGQKAERRHVARVPPVAAPPPALRPCFHGRQS